MSSRRLALTGALAFALLACSKNNNHGAAFPFERAEHFTFACFAPLAAPLQDQYVTLPEYCCRVYDGSAYDPASTDSQHVAQMPGNPPECTHVGGNAVGSTPLLHALVTQSTRGEVAAVDLVNDRVLDSDRLVPGFTFLDTGGLPSAIVVPKVQPRVLQPPAPRAPVTAGPQWTYVASAEEGQVRAIASCRFRSGSACGPDSLPENQNPGYDQRTRFALPSAPRDMILGPGPGGPDSALWVTLPDLGKIVRIDLAETPTVPVETPLPGGPTDQVRSVDAFAVDGTDAQRSLKEPAWFGVPSAAGIVAPEPIAEASEYTAMCGLGHPFAPAQRKLPLAPRSEPSADVQPNLMHFDAESGLLLVTDRVAPVLHVFRFGSDGTLNALPALAMGTVVRDFVITPRVPDNTPRDLLVDPALPDNPAAETKRYLYALDERGLLMLFDFAATPDGARAQPLLAPTPGVGYADRVEIQAPLTALAIIDTRSQSNYVCGQQTPAELSAAIAEEKRAPTRDASLLNGLQARVDIHDLADATHLRGVFLAAASANGTLSILDIHDLDASCRARKYCCVDEACSSGDLTFPRDPSAQNAVAVRRHAIRRSFVGQLETIIPNADLIADSTCHEVAEKFLPIVGTTRVCAPADPWTALADTWAISWEGSLPNTQTRGAAFQRIAGDDAHVEVLAPAEYNFCDTGVMVGDLVAVLGDPPARLQNRCGKPSAADASLYRITEALADRLVVEPTSSTSAPLRSIDEITTCYPDNVGIELRAGGFLVLGTSGAYLHRGITGKDGHCTLDASKDELLTSRPAPVAGDARLVFKNPYVEFTMADELVANEEPALRNTSVQVRNGSSGLQVTSVGSSNSIDALPAALRYDPQLGQLYLLDTASQGLRRYLLRPFQFDTDSFH